QSRCLVGVDDRPHASRRRRRERLTPLLIVERSLLPVDPPITERDLEGALIRNTDESRPLLCDFHPATARCGVMSIEPLLPQARGPELFRRKGRRQAITW